MVHGGVIVFVIGTLARIGLAPASPGDLPEVVLVTFALSWGVVALAAGAVGSLSGRG